MSSTVHNCGNFVHKVKARGIKFSAELPVPNMEFTEYAARGAQTNQRHKFKLSLIQDDD